MEREFDPSDWLPAHLGGDAVPPDAQKALFEALIEESDIFSKTHEVQQPRVTIPGVLHSLMARDHYWVDTSDPVGFIGFATLASAAWVGASGSVTAGVPAGLISGAVTQLQRFVRLTPAERDLVIAWRSYCGHADIYSTTIDAQQLGSRRTLTDPPLADLLHDLKRKGVVDEKPSGWIVLR
ncbi:hypothetical protein [Blastococcus sp. TF02A-26]|uniref:hypothetical protein n=1 Tax=Blastococcus sp. TF02A-26 TaxID=2250577 RepID=UPI000DE8EF11|nr:hypothetical protein [Blastococcus sp. TF02A-26]RBY90597.1 hypothetical protein DQ240_00490 [Blastococcus sp. TF02A-26]